MKTAVVLAVFLGLVVVAAPGWAELVREPEGTEVETPAVRGTALDRGSAPDRGGSLDRGSSLDIDLKIGARGFRFGSRVFGEKGYSGGAWINGETRPDGFSVDGRIEHEGKAHNFRLNADIDEWVRRVMRWRSLSDL
jgi:hypothetical protein